MHCVVLSVYLQPEICPAVGSLKLVILTTDFTSSVCKKQEQSSLLPPHEIDVLFHSLADISWFITSVRYKGKYI